MVMTATELRANLYRVLDLVAEKGETVEIKRKGKILKIVLSAPPNKLSRLIPHPDFATGDLDDIVHMDWSGLWKP